MISINTNLSSIIAQSSMKKATFSLNQAVERMTTGFKINHAKDNAANYSITQNMTTKINSYMVAQDNVAMGLDMLTTAEENLNLISDKLTRLRDLATQASNGTYGESSLNAINAEANALVDEIERLYSTTEYNGVSLYDEAKGAGCDMESLPTAGATGFIKEVQRRDTSGMTKLADVAVDQVLTSGTYSISTPEEMKKLADMTNNDLLGENVEFVLANDIDLSGYSSGNGWVPIGNVSNSWVTMKFTAIFDGNGYKISGLTINSNNVARATPLGLFGNVENATIKNVALVDCDITSLNSGERAGTLVGRAMSEVIIENCYSTGNIIALNSTAGLCATLYQKAIIQNSYSEVDIIVSDNTTGNFRGNSGGLVGCSYGKIINCFATGDIIAGDEIFNIGGLVGCSSGLISNSYATGNVTGESCIGGLVGWLPGNEESKIGLVENCYASGDVTLTGIYSGWLLARAGSLFGSAEETTVKNCTALGKVTTTMADSYELYAFGGAKNSDATYRNQGNEIINCTYDGLKNSGINAYTENIHVENLYDTSKLKGSVNIGLQVGLDSTDNSRISVISSFKLGGLFSLKNIGLDNANCLSKLDKLLATVSSKQTEFGAVQNRLESALDEIETQFNNLVSSRSTLRDADIAEESSAYIRQQILQEASATLLATANQSPSIALQLI